MRVSTNATVQSAQRTSASTKKRRAEGDRRHRRQTRSSCRRPQPTLARTTRRRARDKRAVLGGEENWTRACEPAERDPLGFGAGIKGGVHRLEERDAKDPLDEGRDELEDPVRTSPAGEQRARGKVSHRRRKAYLRVLGVVQVGTSTEVAVTSRVSRASAVVDRRAIRQGPSIERVVEAANRQSRLLNRTAMSVNGQLG